MFGLTLCMGLIGGAYAENDVDPMVQINAGVVKLSASMNMLAAECGDMTEKEVEQARAKQRESAINDLKMFEKDYEKLYAQFAAEVKQQWSSNGAVPRLQTKRRLAHKCNRFRVDLRAVIQRG